MVDTLPSQLDLEEGALTSLAATGVRISWRTLFLATIESESLEMGVSALEDFSWRN